MTAVTATTASPPGRFSITTGWPQRLLNRSPRRRVPKSTPLPGPRVTMNLTGRLGQLCDFDGVSETNDKKSARPVAPSAAADLFAPDMWPPLASHTIIRRMYTCQTGRLHIPAGAAERADVDGNSERQVSRLGLALRAHQSFASRSGIFAYILDI